MTILRAKSPQRAAPLACPRDGTTLLEVDRDGVAIDRCGSCGGLWFDAKELKRVADDREVEKLATRVHEHSKASAFACPRCQGACVRAYCGEVEVDTCADCRGVWLDAGELAEAKRQVEVARVVSAQGAGFVTFLARL